MFFVSSSSAFPFPYPLSSEAFGFFGFANTYGSHTLAMSPLFNDDAPKASTSFIIPDLVSHCNFPLSYNVYGDEVAQESVDWLDTNCPDLNLKQRRDLRGLQAGELTAYCYHTASRERLRVVSDFMNYLFHLCDFFFFEVLLT